MKKIITGLFFIFFALFLFNIAMLEATRLLPQEQGIVQSTQAVSFVNK